MTAIRPRRARQHQRAVDGALQEVPSPPTREPPPVPPAPRIARPAAQRDNRHSLVALFSELDATLPPQRSPPKPVSQSLFDWSDDDLEPPRIKQRRKRSKTKDSPSQLDPGLLVDGDSPDSTSHREHAKGTTSTSTTSRSSAEAGLGSPESEGITTSYEPTASPATASIDTMSGKRSLIRAVRSLKNIHVGAAKMLVNHGERLGMAITNTSEPRVSIDDIPAVPPLPTTIRSSKEQVAAISKPVDAHPTPESSTQTVNVRTSSRKQSSMLAGHSNDTLPRVMPIMSSFLGSPTLLLATPSPKLRQDDRLASSPSVAELKSPTNPLPRSVSSPNAASPGLGIGQKLLRQFSSHTIALPGTTTTSSASIPSSTSEKTVTQERHGSPLAVQRPGLAARRAKKLARLRERQSVDILPPLHLFDGIESNVARELTTAIIRRGEAYGRIAVRSAEELDDKECQYITQCVKEGNRTLVENYLFEAGVVDKIDMHAVGLGIEGVSSQQALDNSDTTSIFSTISGGKIDRALGPDFNPHLSTFGLSAVQYLDNLHRQFGPQKHEAKTDSISTTTPVEIEATSAEHRRHGAPAASDATIRAERSSLDLNKVKITPELKQEIFHASLARTEQLKDRPAHPCLREPQCSGTSSDSSTSASLRQSLERGRTSVTGTSSKGSRGGSDELEVAIDKLLQELQEPSPSCETGQARSGSRLSDTQQVRQSFGLSLLRGPRLGNQKHPKHAFDWLTEKVMCRMVHNPMQILPELPVFKPNSEISLSEFDQHFFCNLNKAEYREPRKCASPVCEQYCCYYGKLIANSAVRDSDILSFSRAMKCKDIAAKLKARKPNGVEEWETFLTCTFCSKLYCPSCIKLCSNVICQQPFCIFCGNGRTFCEDHES